MNASFPGWCLVGLLAAAVVQGAPHRVFSAPPLPQVTVEDGFWKPRIEINRTATLEKVYAKLEESGAIQNFRVASGQARGTVRGPFWTDSDVYKWIEGVSNTLALRRDAALEARLDQVIALIAAAQMPDGYLNTYFQVLAPESRWTNLAFFHELFCAGHLFEAAVAHFEATGKRTLLDVAVRNADHIDGTFGPDRRQGQPGHEEVELALVKLYRATGQKRYLNLARFFLDSRGQKPSYFQVEYDRLDPARLYQFLGRQITARTLADELFRKGGAFDTQYSQDHLPVRQQDKVVGHAVRATYLYAGMADVAAETGDDQLFEALMRLDRDMTGKRMYVTGGIGPSAHNEGFTTDYDLPNETAYQETCASVGVILWNYRMLALTGDGRYADTMELALYNAFPAGVSLKGDDFFYVNPLYSAGKPARQEWFSVPCCPTNVARTMPSVGRYIYAESDDGWWVNLYVRSHASLKSGGGVFLQQETDFPWSGTVRIRVDPVAREEAALHLRIPAWSRKATLRLNGNVVQPEIEKGYAVLRRRWAKGDTVALDLRMGVDRLEANPKVLEDRGKVALRRGPLIYCLEQADHTVDLDRLVLPANAQFRSHFEPGLLGGVTVITTAATAASAPDWGDRLYRPKHDAAGTPVELRAVPYCTWANRGRGKMTVWITAGN